MKTAGVIVNFSKRNAASAAARVAAQARVLGMRILAEPEAVAALPGAEAVPAAAFAAQGAEAVIVLGGDGSLLQAARKLAGTPLPVLGLNIGSLGYLASAGEEEIDEALAALARDDYTVSNRTTLQAAVVRADGSRVELPPALNEVAVTRGGSGRAVTLDLELDGEGAAQFVCDGVLVATPTGSTAYSLAAGGPLLMPDVAGFVVCPICPHALASRPLVVRDGVEIQISVARDDEQVFASVDGLPGVELAALERVRLRRGEDDVKVICVQGRGPCEALRGKLGWGARPESRNSRRDQ